MNLRNRLNSLESKTKGTGMHIVIGKEHQTEKQAKEEYCEKNDLDIEQATLIFLSYDDSLMC